MNLGALFHLKPIMEKGIKLYFNTPNPKKVSQNIIETDLGGNKVWVVEMRYAFEKKEHAEQFIELDSLIRSVQIL